MTVMLSGVLAVLWSCGQVARADFTYGAPTKIPNVSRPGAGGPQISRDGLELYFVCDDEEIWVAKRSATKEEWGAPVRLDPPVNSNGPVGGPCLSADGLELYFGEGHPLHWAAGRVADPRGYGGGDLWVSRRAAKKDPWGKAENLGTVNTASYEDHPCLSADGLSLYFTSDRSGSATLWVTTRASKAAPWGPPATLGAPIDMAMYESSPFISPDGLSLYFSYGGATPDICVSKRTTTAGPWGKPVIFTPVNSPGAEYHLSFSEEDSTLYFTRGDSFYAGYDLWQVKVIPIVDFNGDGKVDEKDFLVMTEHWGQNDPRCDIGPMGWGDGVVDSQDMIVFLETMEGRDFALSPSPQASDVPRDVSLTWTSPQFAKTHDVYFGTSFVDVNSASRGDPRGVLVSKGQTATTYDPEGLLLFGRTYYWRIDEVGAAPDFTLYRGPVLDFKTETHPITGIIAMASSAQASMGPEKTIDGSGLTGDQHGTVPTTMWLSTGVPPNWIQYQFDKVYKLHELWVWNSNQPIESFLGFGAKKVTIEYSVDGTTWTQLDNVPEFARAPGTAGYTPNTIVSLDGVMAKYVKLTINSTWGGMSSVTGLSEVRFFYLPE
jgi:hypothetical protein